MNEIITAHVGSLPFTNIQDALDYTFLFDLPVLFSLPLKDANQFIGRDILSQLDLGEYTSDHKIKLKKNFSQAKQELEPPYLKEFLKRFHNSLFKTFKYQLIGPISFFKLLQNKDIMPEEVFEFLLEKYLTLTKFLSSQAPCLFVLDEPLLNKAAPNELLLLRDFISKLELTPGLESAVHVCSKLKQEQLGLLKDQRLNLDLSLYSAEELSPVKILDFMGLKHGSIAPQYDLDILKSKLGQKTIITPSCGLAFAGNTSITSVLNNLIYSKSLLLAS